MIEQFVLSHDLSEELRNMGFPQDTMFVWYELQEQWVVKSNFRLYPGRETWMLAAPTADEILEQLRDFDWTITSISHDSLSITCESLDNPEGINIGGNLAETLAKLWLQLHEEGHLV